MADTASVRVIKEFVYRDSVRRFSNRYAIGVNNPADDAHWTTLCDAIVAAERHLYMPFASGGARIVEAVAYAHTSEVPVFSKVYTTDGDLSASDSSVVPGDVAALIRYQTPDRSSKNHPVYCFNYYHAIPGDHGASNSDNPHPSAITALGTYAAAWIAGFSDGVTTYHRSRPTGDLCTGWTVSPYFTHRDLRR